MTEQSKEVKNLTNMSQEELDVELAKMRQSPIKALGSMTIGQAMGETPVTAHEKNADKFFAPGYAPDPTFATHTPDNYVARYYGTDQIHAKQINRLANEGNTHAITLRNSGVLVSANGPRDSGFDLVTTGMCGEADRIARLISCIDQWGRDRKLVRHAGCTALAQMKKLKEEVQEIEDAILTGNEIELVDGIGDSLTVIIQLCRLAQVPIEEALERAYSQIRYRKGYMQDGVFVKETK